MKLPCGYFTGSPDNSMREPHLANTYTALCILMQLTESKEEFDSLVDKDKLRQGLGRFQD